MTQSIISKCRSRRLRGKARTEARRPPAAEFSWAKEFAPTPDLPAARIAPKLKPGSCGRRTFRLGPLKEVGAGPDFFEPMAADDLDLWEGGR